MISYIKGKIIAKGNEFLVVDTGGVGYKIFVGDKFWLEAERGDSAELFTVTVLKRDTLELYGCEGWEGMEFLRFLLDISGVGPKTALALSEFGSVEKLRNELEEKGEEAVKKIKGIGKKKMQRILLELTGKIEQIKKDGGFQRAEPEKALSALGFSKQEIQKALSNIPIEIKETEEIVKRALGFLGDAKSMQGQA